MVRIIIYINRFVILDYIFKPAFNTFEISYSGLYLFVIYIQLPGVFSLLTPLYFHHNSCLKCRLNAVQIVQVRKIAG